MRLTNSRKKTLDHFKRSKKKIPLFSQHEQGLKLNHYLGVLMLNEEKSITDVSGQHT